MWQIRYIRHQQIDLLKWDKCIDASPNGLLYAYSWFITEMSPGWDALVLNDYEAVMPLTQRKKWGICYLYQPAFCAELGIFSRVEITPLLISSFFCNIPTHFRFIDICLNRGNQPQGYSSPMRNNYLLSLNTSYERIAANYSLNHKRNIRKALSAGLLFTIEVSVEEAVKIAADTLQYIGGFSIRERQHFVRLYQKAQTLGSALSVGTLSPEGELLSVAVFMQAHGKWHYLLAGSTKKGRKNGAAHFLIDQFIQRYAGTDNTLDFEGSDVVSVALFYSGFGAYNVQYPTLKLNRLPQIIRWLK